MTNPKPRLRKPVLRPTTHTAPYDFELKATVLRVAEREIYKRTGMTGKVSCGMIDYPSGIVRLNNCTLTTPRGLDYRLRQAIREINEGW